MAEQATGGAERWVWAFAGSISPSTGVVKFADSTWLNGQPFDKDLSARVRREVRLANDANCLAVLRSGRWRGGAGAQTVPAVIIGTGCGAGVALNGRAHRRQWRQAGEWDAIRRPWIQADELRYREEVPCYCGKQGCPETFGTGLRDGL
ncbi:ROK family protein [Shigella flexneri]